MNSLLFLGLSVFVATTLGVDTAAAAEFRVGPGGTHATIQSAIDAALAAPGDDLIKVRVGDYPENLVIPDLVDGLEIEGGFDSDFDRRRPWPEQSRVWGSAGTTDLEARVRGGALSLWGLTLGRQDALGRSSSNRGLRVTAGPGSRVYVGGQIVHHGRRTSAESIGGGALIELDQATLTLRSAFHHNEIRSTVSRVAGSALYVRSTGGSRIWLSGLVDDNSSSGPTDGGAVTVVLDGAENDVDLGFTFVHNQALAAGSSERGVADLSVVDRGGHNRVKAHGNLIWGEGHADMARLRIAAGSEMILSDSVLLGHTGRPAARALYCESCEGVLRLTNLTVDGGPIVLGAGAGEVSVANTIVHNFGPGPGIEVPPGRSVTLVNNLVGVDPLFVDIAEYDLRVLPASPAIDAGNDTPPGGLAPTDAGGRPRVQGAHVDIGAWESAGGSSPGAPSNACLVGGFGAIPFVPSFSQACLCLRDAGLRAFRCGFFLPGLFLDALMPRPLLPGTPTDPQWMLHPWQGAEGRYEMDVEILSAGKWVPLKGRGKQTGKLVLDRIERRTFSMLAPQADAPMRARIRHLAHGPNGPGMVEDVVYMLVDVVGKGEKP